MSERWPIEMLEILRGDKYRSTPSGELFTATVTGIKPLALNIRGAAITQNIYANPALMFESDDITDRIEQIFSSVPEPNAATNFLKGFHARFVIHRKDEVLVILNNNIAYVIEKVVAV